MTVLPTIVQAFPSSRTLVKKTKVERWEIMRKGYELRDDRRELFENFEIRGIARTIRKTIKRVPRGYDTVKQV